MASLKHLLDCLGKTGASRSLVKDFFGYRDRQGRAYVPPVLSNPSSNAGSFASVSVLAQARLLQGIHFHLNVILVGDEAFTQSDFETICFGIQQTRFIYGQVGVGIGRVEWWAVSEADAGALAHPLSADDCMQLTNSWSAPTTGMDLFVVRRMSWSGRTGEPYAEQDSHAFDAGHTCDKADGGQCPEQQTGVVARLIRDPASGPDVPDGPHYVGNTFAHEMGHYFGLGHLSATDNFIGNGGGSGSKTQIESWQGDYVKRHCFMRGGC